MYIKRYLIVSYIVSVIFIFGLLYYDNLLEIINFSKEDKLFEIDIPRINFKGNVYNIDSNLNNVDYNIELLDNSNLEENLYFLASHSGSSKASYFDNLVYLEKGSFIILRTEDSILIFVVRDMFYIDKSGYFNVSYSANGGELFLITCSLNYVNRQLIVRAELIYKC